MPLSSFFERPLLIYDDKCYSCAKFAKITSMLSRGWIRTAGHFYSGEARMAKDMVFPPSYDPTAMFWIIDRRGAHGARGGLLPVAFEVLRGLLRGGGNMKKNADRFAPRCEYPGPRGRSSGGQESDSSEIAGSGSNAEPMPSHSCYTPSGVVKRLAGMLRKSKHSYFPPDR